MKVIFENKEALEVYTTGKSSTREIPNSAAHNLVLRVGLLEAITRNDDLDNSLASEYDGDTVSLGDGWRLKITMNPIAIHEIIKPQISQN